MGNSCASEVIMKVDTTGASKKTALQYNLTYKGVNASHQMAQADAARLYDLRIIKRVGREFGIEPAVIAAIISRESRAGNLLQEGAWNREGDLRQCTERLADCIEQIKFRHPDWSKAHWLKGGIAAYNTGVENVHDRVHVDEYTTNGDYSNDVVARAQWYKEYVF
ncbi:lysozyme g-like isoform X2 [Anabas testudineus]|uniref:lysozyme g-like isoform X2 n=1 Tax=Anabas testudineus TaxID=64144 RepID=UPI000E45A85C|nr:lysozyme g-like isoform X2 [Anabas testudineus]